MNEADLRRYRSMGLNDYSISFMNAYEFYLNNINPYPKISLQLWQDFLFTKTQGDQDDLLELNRFLREYYSK